MNKILFASALCLACVGFSAPLLSNPVVTTTTDGAVAPTVTTAAATDQDIANHVKEAFRKDASLQKDTARVLVSVKDKEVTLKGTVADKATSDRFEDVASKVPGVSDVENDLEVAK